MENETKRTQYQTVVHKCSELHRKTISLTAALDATVEALDAIHTAMAFHAHWKPTMTGHLEGIARAALEQAKKARE